MNTLGKLLLAFTLLTLVISISFITPVLSTARNRLLGFEQLHLEKKRESRTLHYPALYPQLHSQFDRFLVQTPTLDAKSGFYDEGLQTQLLSAREAEQSHYRLDGAIPRLTDPAFPLIFSIDKSMILRLRTFSYGRFPSGTRTHTFLVDEPYQLPVLSVVTDPKNFWNRHTGMYQKPFRKGPKWSRIVAAELLLRETPGIGSFPARLRIQGAGRRSSKKKTFELSYQVAHAKGLPPNSVLASSLKNLKKQVIIRVDGNFGEPLYHRVHEAMGGYVSDFETCVLLLNGEYWGIYNLRESIDAHYLQQKFGKGSFDLVRLRRESELGDLEHWSSTLEFFRNANLNNPLHMKRAHDLLDIENTFDYWIANIYAANTDWPYKNGYMFRYRTDSAPAGAHGTARDGKWRWISWDADGAFASRSTAQAEQFGSGFRNNTIRWTKNAGPVSVIFWKLLESDSLRKMFVRRFLDLLNTELLPEHVEEKLSQIIDPLEDDLPGELTRWDYARDHFRNHFSDLREFIRNRPSFMHTFLEQEFSLGALYPIVLRIAPLQAGTLHLNSLRLTESPWKGNYNSKIQLKLRAVPRQGFQFRGWRNSKGQMVSEAARFSVRLREPTTLTAVFEPQQDPEE